MFSSGDGSSSLQSIEMEYGKQPDRDKTSAPKFFELWSQDTVPFQQASGCTKAVRVFFWIVLVLYLMSVASVLLFAYILILNGPWWQIHYAVYASYIVFSILSVAFFVLWYFYPDAGDCSSSSSSSDCRRLCGTARCCARSRQMAWSWQFLCLLVAIMWCVIMWSMVCAFIWGYLTDDNEKVTVTRLGAVTDSSFAAFVHYPGASTIAVEYRLASSSGAFTTAASLAGSLGTLRVTGLTSATQYTYRVTVDGVVSRTDTVKTSPVPGAKSKFMFSFGSCFIGNQMFKGVTYPANKDLRGWAKVSLPQRKPDFIAFLGDFIYTDHPYYIGDDFNSFAIRYRQSMGNEWYAKMSANIPQYYIYDDHEITDNVAILDLLAEDTHCFSIGSVSRCFDSKSIANNGLAAYRTFLGNANPHPYPDLDANNRGVDYYHWVYGDSAFFMLDLRGFRNGTSLPPNSPFKSALGAIQLQRLKDWLMAVNSTSTFKFIFSGDPVTRFLDGAKSGKDSWADYVVEREALLDFITLNGIHNVVFLSGDLHTPYVVELRKGMWEFSCSGLAIFSSQTFGELTQTNLDYKLHWWDESNVWYFGKPETFSSFVYVDSTASPPNFRVDYYTNEQQDVPCYTVTLRAGIELF